MSCLAGLALAPLSCVPAHADTVTIAIDDNYPPYVFRNEEGELEGYLVDLWKLWERQTGNTVDLRATDWAKAQALFNSGKADVIETIFRTTERERASSSRRPMRTFRFSIYADAQLEGLTNPKSLRGFVVGAKAGDACIDRLRQDGVNDIRAYPNYSAVIAGAIAVMCESFVWMSRRQTTCCFRRKQAGVPQGFFPFLRSVPSGGEDRKRRFAADGAARFRYDFPGGSAVCARNGLGPRLH